MKIEKPSDSAAELRRQTEAKLKEPYIQVPQYRTKIVTQ
jgi:hypothetical protein